MRSSDFVITHIMTDRTGVHSVLLPLLIVSITKFSIVIGSPRAYLSRNRRAIMWVSNYSNRTPVIGYPRIFTSITRDLMASLAMFSTVFKT